ncbi:MAG: outer membrane protein assembly factor BamD [Gemmatimonadetes bacterium]|nr:outer membrane protein assembly factor BamD [Gemmatimonadota bacterium]
MRTLRGLWLIGVLGLAACGRGPGVRTAPDPAALLARARNEFRHGKFTKALLLFQRLTFELGPGQAELADVRYHLAECYFQTGDRVQAAHEFRQVADQFPESPWAPLALLRAGDANLRLWRKPDLDPSYGEAALAIYQELAGRYPGTDPAARASLHVRQLKEQFAEKAYRTGTYYLRRWRAYDSAIIYFKDVIASYPGTSRVPDALLRLVEIYRAINYTEEVRETCAHLQRYYPQTPGLAQRCPAEASGGAP